MVVASERVGVSIKITDPRTGESKTRKETVLSDPLKKAIKRRGSAASRRRRKAQAAEMIARFKIKKTPVIKTLEDVFTSKKVKKILPKKIRKDIVKQKEILKKIQVIERRIKVGPKQITLKQIIQGVRPPKQPPKEIFNTLRIAPKQNLSKFKKFENYIYDEFIRIQRKNVNSRTQKEMALIGLYGIGSAGIGTIRKIPQATWDTLAAFIRPDLIVSGIVKIATDSKVRAKVKTQIEQFGGKLQRGDPQAVSTLAAEIIGIKAANKIVAETGKVVSVTKPIRILKEIKFTRSQPKELRLFVKQILKAARVQENLSPTKLKGIKKINFNEVQELNKIEAKALKKTLQQTDSFVFGSLPSRTLSKGKTKLPKDVDLATKNIKKFQQEFIKNLPVKIRSKYIVGKEFIRKGNTKILDIKGYDRLRPDQTIFGTGRLPINAVVYSSQGKKLLKTAGLKIPTKSLKTIEGVKIVGFGEQTSRKALGTLQVILEKGGRRAKDPAAFIESLEIQLAGLQGKISKAKFVNKYLLKSKAADLKNAIKILKSKQFEKILNKKVPGLTKEFPIIKKINKLSSKQKIKITADVKKRINKIKGIDKKITKVKPKAKLKKRPKSKSKIPVSKVPKSRIPVSKIPKSRIPVSKVPKSRIPVSKVPKSRIPISKIPKSRVPVSKIPKSRIPVSKVPKSRIPVSKVPVSKIPVSKIPKSRIPVSKIPKSAITTTSKTKPKKTVLLNLNSKLPKGERLKFDVRFKTKGRVQKIKIGLPRNRALSKLSHAIDNTLPRSAELFISGITKAKDISKPSLRKFRVGKTKRTLKLVEKTKFAIDTRGEKKKLSLARALAPKKKKKVIKKKKVKKVVKKNGRKTRK